jgi:hypothetical protein
LNKQSWSGTGPNTWLVEPIGLPSKNDRFNVTGFGRGCKKQDGFQLWVESQKEPEIQPKPIVKARIWVSRVKMNAKKTAPLTPKSSPSEIPAVFFKKHPEKEP